MESFMNWMSTNPGVTISLGAFACGVALFYLVMRRTMKHREETSQTDM